MSGSYTLVNATVIGRTIGSQWRDTDLSNIIVFDIFNTYYKVYLTIKSIFLTDYIYVDMETLKAEYSSYSGTLSELLLLLDGVSLTTVSSLPNTTIKYAKYANAYQAGYKVDLCKIGYDYPDSYPKSELTDLIITRPNYTTDISLIHNYCLTTVNGFIHNTSTDGTDTYVVDGGKSSQKANDNHLGMLSFLDVGKLTKVGITEDMILQVDENTSLSKRLYIKIDNDTTDKTVMLVLGGYLILPSENIFWPINDTVYALNVSALPLLERYFESKNSIDLSGLGLASSSTNEDVISAEEFYTDSVIKNYLQLTQSFICIVDTNNLFTDSIYIRHSNLPGMFTAYQDPVYPLCVGYGRMIEYWKVQPEGEDIWSVTTNDAFYRNYVFSYTPRKERENVTSNQVPSFTHYKSRGNLLMIGSYK